MVGLMAILTIWAFSQSENQKVLALASKDRGTCPRRCDSSKQENYYNQIALANAKFQDGDFDSAQNLLWATDPKFRHWEWGRLLSLTNNSLWIYRTDSNPSKIEITDDEKYAVVTMTGDKINIIELGNPNISRAISIHQQNAHKRLAKSPKDDLFATAGTGGEFVFGSVQAVRFFTNLPGTLKDFKL